MKYYYRLVDWVRNLLSLSTVYCEECEKPVEAHMNFGSSMHYICETCYERIFCECGYKLDDGYGGSNGDGFCIRCR